MLHIIALVIRGGFSLLFHEVPLAFCGVLALKTERI